MSFTIKIDTGNIDRFRALLAEFPEIMERHFDRASVLAVSHLEGAIKQNVESPYGSKPPAVAFSYLAGGIFGAERTSPIFGGVVEVNPPADVYAGYVETGTSPHFPPIEPLMLWAKRKFAVDEKEAKSIAFAIARKISVSGTKGHFMFQRAVENEQDTVIGFFDQALESACAEVEAGV